MPTTPARRRGFTVAELLVAAALTAVLFAVAIPFFLGQARAVAQHAGRLDAQLGVRYGLASIDRDLRSAGVGVVDAQPMVVEGDARALTFNADLVSQDTGYAGAVNYDPDAAAGGVGVLERDAPVRLPATGRQYPDCTYVQSGTGQRTDSRAETVSYWVRQDSTSGRSDEYVLFRRVNRLAPELVVRGVVLQPGEAVFTYFKNDSAGRLIEVRADSLPIVHTAAMHGSAGDVGRSALTDSVRVVRVRLAGRARDRRTGRTSVAVAQTRVRLLNAGLLRRTTCGEAPLQVTTFTAQVTTAGGIPSVTLRWPASTDEAGGERDVERYLIFRRLESGPADFDEPLLSLVSGRTTYTYVDNQVTAGARYVYGLAAQDCSPQNSSVVQTGTVQP